MNTGYTFVGPSLNRTISSQIASVDLNRQSQSTEAAEANPRAFDSPASISPQPETYGVGVIQCGVVATKFAGACHDLFSKLIIKGTVESLCRVWTQGLL